MKKISFDIIIHNVGGSKKIYDYNMSSDNYKMVWDSNFGYVIEINNFFIPYMKKKNGEELFMYHHQQHITFQHQ